MIQRIQGNFDEARRLFGECLNKLGLLNNARIYRELALVEYLVTNESRCPAMAQIYNEHALDLFRSLGIPDNLISDQCCTCSRFVSGIEEENAWYRRDKKLFSC